MAELKIGDEVHGAADGKITALMKNGYVEIDGEKVAHVSKLLPGPPLYRATATVIGLQPDPPHHIARMAEKGIAILPSPVAPETDKSGIVPTGEVKYLGMDGFLHVVPEASINPDGTNVIEEE